MRLGSKMNGIYLALPDHAWTLRCDPTQAAGPAPVYLGSAADYVILSKTGVSSTDVTSMVRNIGVATIASPALTRFGLILSPTGTYSTSSLVNGRVYAANSARTPVQDDLSGGACNGNRIHRRATTSPDRRAVRRRSHGADALLRKPEQVGDPASRSCRRRGAPPAARPYVCLDQIAQNLTVESGGIVTLAGGANPANIFSSAARDEPGIDGANVAVLARQHSQDRLRSAPGRSMLGRTLAHAAPALDANSGSTAASDNAIFIDCFGAVLPSMSGRARSGS